jgi:hypothetical protein
MAKSKKNAEPQTSEDRNRARLLRWAESVMDDPDASTVDKSRAADVIFRATPGLATKPADPTPSGETLSEATARRMCDLAERLLL